MGQKRKMVWLDEEIEYLRSIAKGKSRQEIIELMSLKFSFPYTFEQIKGAMSRHSIRCEHGNGRFQKGNVAWNKGTKGLTSANVTSFKKGDKPKNWRPVGSERINVYGYWEIKVAEKGSWKLKHRVIYEQHHGPIPRNKNVIFADGNKNNLSIDNLLLVSKGQLALMNKNGLVFENPEATKVGANVAELMIQIKKRTSKE